MARRLAARLLAPDEAAISPASTAFMCVFAARNWAKASKASRSSVTRRCQTGAKPLVSCLQDVSFLLRRSRFGVRHPKCRSGNRHHCPFQRQPKAVLLAPHSESASRGGRPDARPLPPCAE